LRKDEKGISPIVGAILVVAMTIMLAVAAWSYLGNLAATPSSKVYQVVAKATENNTGWITVTYLGGPDHNTVDYLTVSVSVGDKMYEIKVMSENESYHSYFKPYITSKYNSGWYGGVDFDGDNTADEDDAYGYVIVPLDSDHFDGTPFSSSNTRKVTYDDYKNFRVVPSTGIGYTGNNNDVKIGATVGIQGTPGASNNHVIVTAVFTDGTTQTILDTWT
jgi:flagellin-like protein